MEIRKLRLDLDSRKAEIELSDGSTRSEPLSEVFGEEEPVLRVMEVDVVTGLLSIKLPAGDFATLEIGGDPHDLDGRPVLYLDQLHWIKLAQCRWAPEKTSAEERDAAAELAEMARDRQVIVPASSGNITELTGLRGDHRRHLATTMIQLSAGWVLRDPITIRDQEIQRTMAGLDGECPKVFTRESWAMTRERLAPPELRDSYPPPWPEIHRRAVEASSMYASIVADEDLSSEEGSRLAAQWASNHSQIAGQLRSEGSNKSMVRNVAFGALISDLQNEIAAAASGVGMPPAVLVKWLDLEMPKHLASMPSLGRYFEVMVERLKNADDRWHSNDLNDMVYLSCAAAYADVVAGEKKMASYLRRVAGRVPAGAQVERTLPSAVTALREL